MAPIGFFCYGGLVAVQTLWAAPWMIRVAGYSPLEAAAGLFWINCAMLLAFWSWGMAGPRLARRGLHADRLISFGLHTSFAVLTVIVVAGSALSTWTGALWALYCVSCTFVALAQPPVGMAFALGLAEIAAFQAAMGLFLLCCVASYVYFLTARSHNQSI